MVPSPPPQTLNSQVLLERCLTSLSIPIDLEDMTLLTHMHTDESWVGSAILVLNNLLEIQIQGFLLTGFPVKHN